VERHEVMRCVRVEHGAHPLGRLVDLAVVVVLRAALEDQVLEEMRHAVLLGALGAGAGVERDEDGRGACAVALDPVKGRAGGERRAFYSSHAPYLTNVPWCSRCRIGFRKGPGPFARNTLLGRDGSNRTTCTH